MNATIVDVLIENIKKDQLLLEETEKQIEAAKEAKREVVDRLKNYRKDVGVMLKYANEAQQKRIADLGFDFTSSERGLNPVASLALDLVMKAKNTTLTNGTLYEAYKKGFKNPEDAFSYTEFNIKCRGLFNTQRLLRKKGKDPKNSREDIISLNGRVADSSEAKTKKDGSVSK